MRIAALAVVAATLASCGGGARAPIAEVDGRAARSGRDGSGATIASVGKMTLRKAPEGRLFVVSSGTYLVTCEEKASVARVILGQVAPAAALEQALAGAGFSCIHEIADGADGRMVLSGTTADGTSVASWDGRALAPSAMPPPDGPARLAFPSEQAFSGEVPVEEIQRGRIVVEPEDRYPRAETPVVRMRGQLRLANGGLVVVGHVVEGLLAAETWRAPFERGRVELLPGAPPWSNWDPYLSPRVGQLASPLPGHACVVPTAMVETMGLKYLACFDGERWREIDTAPLDGIITSLAAAEGWIWVTTASNPLGVYRLRLGGTWERVGEISDADDLTVRMRSAREVYLVGEASSWVALEAP